MESTTHVSSEIITWLSDTAWQTVGTGGLRCFLAMFLMIIVVQYLSILHKSQA